MRLLLIYGKDIKASQAEKYDFTIKVTSSQLDFDGILAWIKEKEVLRGNE